MASGTNIDTVLGKTKSAQASEGLAAVLQLGTMIKGQREASGAAQSRRDRIAACGRKPVLGFGKKFRKRKDEYNKCVAEAEQEKSTRSETTTTYRSESDAPAPKDKTLMYVGIGVGVLILGTITYFILKKK